MTACGTPAGEHVLDSAATTVLFVRYTDGCAQTWAAAGRGDAPRPETVIEEVRA